MTTWNILADGLAHGEFLTDGGDASVIDWDKRKDKIVSIMNNLFNIEPYQEDGVSIIATQENDHFVDILKDLQTKNKDIKGLLCLPQESTFKVTPSERMRIQNALRQVYSDDTIVVKKDGEVSAYKSLMDYYTTHNHSQFLPFSMEPNEFNTSQKEKFGIDPDQHNAPLISPEGLGIYWDSKKVELIGYYPMNTSGNAIKEKTPVENEVIYNINKQIVLKFKTVDKARSRSFIVGVAHLKSGESLKGERQRSRELRMLLSHMKAVHEKFRGDFKVLLMDSNNNESYEETAQKHLQKECILLK